MYLDLRAYLAIITRLFRAVSVSSPCFCIANTIVKTIDWREPHRNYDPQYFATGGITAYAIACLSAESYISSIDQIRAALASPYFPWAGFLEYVRSERISPQVHRALAGKFDIPAEVSTRLYKDYLNCVYANSRRWEDLRQILAAFARAGIPVTLLKGAALMCTLYEKRGLRPMTDMDLLVQPADFDHACQSLASIGYEPVLDYIYAEETLKHIAYHKLGVEDSKVELHRTLFSAPHELTNEQSAWFWEYRERGVYDGVEIWTLNPTAQLLHICAHLWLGHSDEGDNLLRLNDANLLIHRRHEDIDWRELLSAAHSFELLLPLQKTLPELACSWQAPVSQSVVGELTGIVPSVRERRKFGKHWGNHQNYLSTLIGGAMSYPNWRSRLHFARLIVFPPWQYIVNHYRVRSPLLVPYYYLYRLFYRVMQQVRIWL